MPRQYNRNKIRNSNWLDTQQKIIDAYEAIYEEGGNPTGKRVAEIVGVSPACVSQHLKEGLREHKEYFEETYHDSLRKATSLKAQGIVAMIALRATSGSIPHIRVCLEYGFDIPPQIKNEGVDAVLKYGRHIMKVLLEEKNRSS